MASMLDRARQLKEPQPAKTILARSEAAKLQLAQETVDYLNELHKLHETAISALVNYRVPANCELSEHPTVQTEEVPWTASPAYIIGMLGVINGLIGVGEDGVGYVVASYDDESGKLLGFSVPTKEQREQLRGLPVKGAVLRARRED